MVASERVRIKRIMKRDGATESEAAARIRAQMPDSEKVALADVVIDNGGQKKRLYQQVAAAVGELRAKYGG